MFAHLPTPAALLPACSVAAWVIAGGLAMGYQYYRQKADNGAVMDAAEVEAFNAQRKAATAAAAAAAAEAAAPADAPAGGGKGRQ